MKDTEDLETKRKRLRFRSWHRGIREMDLLVGSFADKRLAELDAEQLSRYEELLLESDPDLYAWMTGRAEPPDELNHDVMQMMRQFEYKPQLD
ncbi:MAG: succinate dehydrogenase assembly factor 2 [Pseudomonadota bacterium]|uniref:FAD assembly factor SdhE n=1 Tax=Fodinicurvata fenggangensis TaxID=1121830 RepID=UPI00047A25BE|nr:succinate dehydrogenase assembly factor 2 [Fodinicurvata fenggangensis]